MSPRLWPWSAPVALAAAALGALGDAYHLWWSFGDLGERSALLATAAYRAHGVAIALGYGLALFALGGLAARLGPRLPRVAWAGVLVAFVGTTLVAGDYWAESVVVPSVVAPQPTLADADPAGGHLALVIVAFALLALGWLLFALATMRAKLLPRAPLVALALGALVAFTPFPGSNLLLFLAVGWVGLAGRGDPTA